MVKNQDDGLQIVEQILPYFQPEYNVTITPVDGFAYKQDVSVILGGVQIEDQYEGEFTERRVLIYQLDFTMKMKFFGPTADQAIIREVNLDFHDKDVTTALFEEMDFTVVQAMMQMTIQLQQQLHRMVLNNGQARKNDSKFRKKSTSCRKK